MKTINLFLIIALLIALSKQQCDIQAKIQYNLEEEKYAKVNKLQVFQTLEEGINMIFFEPETFQKIDSKVFKTAEVCEEVPEFLELLNTLNSNQNIMIFQTYGNSSKCFKNYPELKNDFDTFFSQVDSQLPSLYEIDEQKSLVIIGNLQNGINYQYVQQENQEEVTEICLLQNCETLFGNICQSKEFLNKCYEYLGELKEDTVLGYMGFEYNEKNHKKEITMDFQFKDLNLEKLECFTYDLRLKDSEIKIEDRRPTQFDGKLSHIKFVEDEKWLMDNGCLQYQDEDFFYWECSIQLDIVFAGYVQENFSETMRVKLRRQVANSINVQYQDDNNSDKSQNTEFQSKKKSGDVDTKQDSTNVGKDQIQKQNVEQNNDLQQTDSNSKSYTSLIIIMILVVILMAGYMGYKKWSKKLNNSQYGRQRFQEEI